MITVIDSAAKIWLAAAIALHYPLAVLSLVKLFKRKRPVMASALWNMVIMLGVIVGPVLFLIIDSRKRNTKSDKTDGRNDGAPKAGGR